MSVCLRGKLSERKEDRAWTWKGEWAFGETMDSGGLPFDYTFAHPHEPVVAPPPASDPSHPERKEPAIIKIEETKSKEPVASNPIPGSVVAPPATSTSVAVGGSQEPPPAPKISETSIVNPPTTTPAVPPVESKKESVEEEKSPKTPDILITKQEAPEPNKALSRTVVIQGQTLPASGKWTGSFMTLGTARKGMQPPHVPVNEHFFISWQGNPKEGETSLPTPIHQVRVTGNGENQYGRFSLTGFLNLTTSTLQCQRKYILQGDDSTPRSYQTRKRQLTWKRRAAMDEEPMQLKKLPPPKKQKLSINLPASMGPKKRQVITKQQVGQIKLPSAGEPSMARWRAAHFFHYQAPTTDKMTPKYVIYEGELLHQKRHGRGVCLYNNGMLYEGEWKLDKEHGHGKLMTSDRKHVSYEGAWERGRMHGEGIYRYSPNSHYAGEFRENLRHGDGSYRLEDGSVYEGSWRDGAMFGKGVFSWPDGSVYDGEWKDSKRHGVGILKTADGFTYDGAWVFNSMEGRGSATYPGGQEYHGMWSRGRREGRGTIHFTNGAVYEGRFKNDAIEGQGTLKIARTLNVPNDEGGDDNSKPDFMIPVSFQSDLGHIHRKAGFSNAGQ